MRHLKSHIKNHFQEILKLKTSDHEIALGFAVGSFISILPTPGFNILLGTLIILIYERISKISLFVGMAFWNPITMIPVYSAAYRIGSMLFGTAPVVKFDLILLNQVYNFSRRLLLGITILAVILSILSYFIIRGILILNRKYKRFKSIR